MAIFISYVLILLAVFFIYASGLNGPEYPGTAITAGILGLAVLMIALTLFADNSASGLAAQDGGIKERVVYVVEAAGNGYAALRPYEGEKMARLYRLDRVTLPSPAPRCVRLYGMKLQAVNCPDTLKSGK